MAGGALFRRLGVLIGRELSDDVLKGADDVAERFGRGIERGVAYRINAGGVKLLADEADRLAQAASKPEFAKQILGRMLVKLGPDIGHNLAKAAEGLDNVGVGNLLLGARKAGASADDLLKSLSTIAKSKGSDDMAAILKAGGISARGNIEMFVKIAKESKPSASAIIKEGVEIVSAEHNKLFEQLKYATTLAGADKKAGAIMARSLLKESNVSMDKLGEIAGSLARGSASRTADIIDFAKKVGLSGETKFSELGNFARGAGISGTDLEKFITDVAGKGSLNPYRNALIENAATNRTGFFAPISRNPAAAIARSTGSGVWEYKKPIAFFGAAGGVVGTGAYVYGKAKDVADGLNDTVNDLTGGWKSFDLQPQRVGDPVIRVTIDKDGRTRETMPNGNAAGIVLDANGNETAQRFDLGVSQSEYAKQIQAGEVDVPTENNDKKGSWLGRNWGWVAAGVGGLLALGLFGGGGGFLADLVIGPLKLVATAALAVLAIVAIPKVISHFTDEKEAPSTHRSPAHAHGHGRGQSQDPNEPSTPEPTRQPAGITQAQLREMVESNGLRLDALSPEQRRDLVEAGIANGEDGLRAAVVALRGASGGASTDGPTTAPPRDPAGNGAGSNREPAASGVGAP